MIRFIDLRDQIIDVEDQPSHFAFYDTVRSTFLTFSGTCDWESRDEFMKDLSSDADMSHWQEQKERFLRKLPEWVP